MPIEFDSKIHENTWTYEKGVSNELKGCILAAGLGSRMMPLTVSHLPKPMFPLGGNTPMAEAWVRRFVESGITDISMNLCVLSDTIREHFMDGSKFGAKIAYVDEKEPTGTLGGVCKQALGNQSGNVFPGDSKPLFEEFGGSTLIVPSGDIVTNFGTEHLERMYEIHKKAGAAFSMVLVPVPWDRRKDFGTVVLDNPEKMDGAVCKSGRITEFREKDPDSPSNLNNASIYMIEMDLLKTIDSYRTMAGVDVSDPFYDFGKHVFPAMLGELPHVKLPKDYLLWGVEYDGLWLDVGQKKDYLKVNELLLDGKIDMQLPYEKLPWGRLGINSDVDFSKVRIVPPVVIGNNCVVEPGASLGPYAVIGDDWKIEKNACVRNSVLWGRYDYFNGNGSRTPAADRRPVDRHEIRGAVTVEECIVVGGTIETDVRGKTVEVLEDGRLEILPIDYVPSGPRA